MTAWGAKLRHKTWKKFTWNIFTARRVIKIPGINGRRMGNNGIRYKQNSRIIRGERIRNIGAYNNNFYNVCSFAYTHSSRFTPNLYKSERNKKTSGKFFV